ncbi:MAG: DNA polymerase III subunit beta [Chitinivibrionia bacterium]|nr:DNA polymerase III subunit beta [Chitinivibrionia bacterium]
MKISIDQEVLLKKIMGISSVVPTKTSLPILSTFLVEAGKGKVFFTANDLDVSLTTAVECELHGDGEIAVPGKKFFEIARSLPADKVEVSAEGDRLSIKCRKSRFRIVGKSASEFPKLPEQKPLAAFTLDTKILDTMISKTIYAVSNDLTRPSLCGVLWQLKQGSFIMVATDGHRLSKVEYRGQFKEGGDAGDREFIVSPKALNILRALFENRAEVSIKLAENHITFDLGDSIVYSRLLEGPFPDYNQVIPRENKKELVVNREEFTQACKRVSILSSVITHQIRMSIKGDAVTLSVNTPDLGEAVEEIPCSFNSEQMDIGYNARYLLDMLRTMDTEDVSFHLDRNDNAGMLLPYGEEGDLKYQCLLMPLRLSDSD